jgi:predicted ATPase
MKHREVGSRCFSLAEQRSDTTLLMVAHFIIGINLLHTGEYVTGLEHLEQAHVLYDPWQSPTHVTLGVDMGIFALAYSAHALWGLGYPKRAMQRINETLALVQKVRHPFSIALAQAYAVMLYQFCQEPHTASEHASLALAFCTENNIGYYWAWATIIQGWSYVEQGQREEGIAQMHQGLKTLQATDGKFKLRLPYYLSLLAEAYRGSGQIEKGLHLLDEAFAEMQQTGEYCWEADLHRIQGDLLLAHSTANDTAAEACLHKALDVARRQQAKSFELRAATSLARLWQSQDKRQVAYDLLEPVYNWFTEGFETADLQDAKTLLTELKT